MGEDVHSRVYVKLKKTGQYVNAHEFCAWDPKYTAFEELLPDRNYDLFSLFGSMRGNYKPLENANYGLPDFLKDSPLQEYCESACYYGFIWFTLPQFLDAIEKYLKKLKNPLLYFTEDDNSCYDDWHDMLAPGNYTAADIEKVVDELYAWNVENSALVKNLERMQNQLQQLRECAKEDTVVRSIYGKMFDPDDTVFLFFFDN